MNLQKNAPLVERHRPQSLQQIVGQQNVVAVLQGFVKHRNMPNIMLSGIAGVGKTSAAFSFINDFYAGFGISEWSSLVLSINASRENGIETIREQITPFTNASYRSQPGVCRQLADAAEGDLRLGTQTTVPKIVVLDEADQLTKVAQWALGPIIDQCTDNARFIFIVNYERKIQDDLKSRCQSLRFPPLPREAVKRLIANVCVQEKISFEPRAAAAIAVVSQNDMRRALNVLSSCVVQKKAEPHEPLTDSFVYRAAGRVEPSVTLALLQCILTDPSVGLADVCKRLQQHMIEHSISPSQLLCDMHDICTQLAAPNDKLDTIIVEENAALSGIFEQDQFAQSLFEDISLIEKNLLAITDSARMLLHTRAFGAALWKLKQQSVAKKKEQTKN